jgi:colicin import membrane protein
MPGDPTTKPINLREKPVVSAGTGEPLSKWLLFSFFLHGALLIALVLSPYFPSQTTSAPPVYTVDLVGGDKIGGNRPGTQIEPSPPPKETKQEAKEAPKMMSEPAPSPPEIKKEPPKIKQKVEKTEITERANKVEKAEKFEKPAKKLEKPPKIEEKPAQDAVKPAPARSEATKQPVQSETLKKEPLKELKSEVAKNEPAKEGRTEPVPAQSSEGSLDKVRERLIQSALDRVKSRTESAQKASKTGDVLSVGPGEGDGAAALGPGGRGGGTVVKGAEFLMYQTKIVSTIKGNWAWAGQKGTLKALVRFGIKDNGEITGIRIAEPSGDPAFDESVLRALRKSSPLPAPPESYRNDFSQVEMNFQP